MMSYSNDSAVRVACKDSIFALFARRRCDEIESRAPQPLMRLFSLAGYQLLSSSLISHGADKGSEDVQD